MTSKFFSGDQSEKMIAEEKAFLEEGRAKRRGRSDAPWTGLALSGGGIRSATIALGVLQALARNDLLKKFDYISTVSGGGYIGASLQWWWSKEREARERAERGQDPWLFGLTPTDFPFGTASFGTTSVEPKDSDLQKANLQFLRNHGNYLAPGSGISAWSLLAVVLRTVFLSILIWLPLCSLVLAVVYGLDYGFLKLPFPKNPWQTYFEHFLTCGNGCSGTARIWYEAAKAVVPPVPYVLPLLLLVTLTLLFAALTIVFGLQSRSSNDNRPHAVLKNRLVAAVLAILSFTLLYQMKGNLAWSPADIVAASLLVVVGFTLVLRIGLDVFSRGPVSWSYAFRRWLEWLSGYCLPRALFLVLALLIPLLTFFLVKYLNDAQIQNGSTPKSAPTAAAAFAILSAVAGVLSALYGYYTSLQKIAPGLAGKIFAPLGAGLFLFAFVTVAYWISIVPSVLGGTSTLLNLLTKDPDELQAFVLCAFLGSVAFACLLALMANVNNVGLHRFYRDRLMEAYLPGQEAVENTRAAASPIADRLLLSDLIPSFSTERSEPAPFPIINATAVITNDADHRIETRGGDNFALTPLFVGCSATGWESTRSHDNRHDPITLATAMAASGAAVNSNAGYIGTGETRNPIVSTVMALLNIRLGVWVGTPRATGTSRRVPNFLSPTFATLFGRGQRRSSRFLELADGGNFENLGIYELVRRKLKLILVVDGEADEAIALPALVSAIHRVFEDFEATVSFSTDFGPDRIVPSANVEGYPNGARFSASPFFLGEITYKGGERGVLVYIKSVLFKKINFTTAGYRARFADFPHQSTFDQFFDPDQFEAYRDLGYCSASFAISSLQLKSLIDVPDHIIRPARYD
jgi:hypothetical protein